MKTERILAIQLKRIGDLILTTPALAALRRHRPDAEITLLVSEGCKELLPGIASADRVLIHTPGAANWKLWAEMFAGRYHACLDFTVNDRSALCSLLSTAATRATFDLVRKAPWRAFLYNRLVASPVREWHTADHHIHLLSALGIEAFSADPALSIPDWAESRAIALLAAAGVSEPFAVAHPGTARMEKAWPAERWAETLAAARQEHGFHIVLTGSGEPAEQKHLQAIRALAPFCLDLSAKPDLLALAAILRRARIALSVDSAAMHVACCVGTPQVALFGPTNPFHWRPRQPLATVVSAACDGQPREFAPRAQGAPMERLSTRAVLDAIRHTVTISTSRA